MATSPEYTQYVLDLLTAHCPVQARKMFGGVGLFGQDGMFALISGDDTLYFKVDDVNRPDYEAAGMPQFMKMPYFQLPVDVLEDTAVLEAWVRRSLQAARRAAEKKKK